MNTELENRQGRRKKNKHSTNANANVNGAVKVTMGKNFRFGGKTVRSTEAAVA